MQEWRNSEQRPDRLGWVLRSGLDSDKANDGRTWAERAASDEVMFQGG